MVESTWIQKNMEPAIVYLHIGKKERGELFHKAVLFQIRSYATEYEPPAQHASMIFIFHSVSLFFPILLHVFVKYVFVRYRLSVPLP